MELPDSQLEVGLVRILEGPLRDHVGKVSEVLPGGRLIVVVNLMGEETSVEVEPEDCIRLD